MFKAYSSVALRPLADMCSSHRRPAQNILITSGRSLSEHLWLLPPRPWLPAPTTRTPFISGLSPLEDEEPGSDPPEGAPAAELEPPALSPDSMTTVFNSARVFQTQSLGMSSGGGHGEGQKGDDKTLLSFLLKWV